MGRGRHPDCGKTLAFSQFFRANHPYDPLLESDSCRVRASNRRCRHEVDEFTGGALAQRPVKGSRLEKVGDLPATEADTG